MPPKYFSTFWRAVVGTHVARDHDHGVGGAVVRLEPVLHVVERRGIRSSIEPITDHEYGWPLG